MFLGLKNGFLDLRIFQFKIVGFISQNDPYFCFNASKSQ